MREVHAYRGKILDDMTTAELREVINDLAEENERQRAECARQRDVWHTIAVARMNRTPWWGWW